MSNISQFLFQGSTPLPVPTGSDTTSTFPLWLQQANYNLANAATSLAQQPYTPFPGPQVYTPSSQTQQAWSLASQDAGNWQPALSNATNLTNEAATPISSGDINQFLNPYTNDVVGALQSASNKNFFTNVLPQVNDQFVGAGQSRSPQEMQATNNAIYNNQQALDQSTSSALQSGYSGALTAAQAQKATEEAAGAQSGQLGALGSQLGAYDISALSNAGQQQDALAQTNINTAEQNFQNQEQWPYANLSYASDIVRGLQAPTSSQTVGTSIPTTNTATIGSPLQTALGVAQLANSLNLAKGGRVRGALAFAQGGGASTDDGSAGSDGPSQPTTGGAFQPPFELLLERGTPAESANEVVQAPVLAEREVATGDAAGNPGYARGGITHEDMARIHQAIMDPHWYPGKYAKRSVRHFDLGGAVADMQSILSPASDPSGAAGQTILSPISDPNGAAGASGGNLSATNELQTQSLGNAGQTAAPASSSGSQAPAAASAPPPSLGLSPPSSWDPGVQQLFNTQASPNEAGLDPATQRFLAAVNEINYGDSSGQQTPAQDLQMRDFAIARQAANDPNQTDVGNYIDNASSSTGSFLATPSWAQPSVLRLAMSQLNVPIEAAGYPDMINASPAGGSIGALGLTPWWTQ